MRSAISERYPPAVIDAHAHLTDRRFDADVAEVLERARKAGIERILTAGEDVASSDEALALAAHHGDVRVAVGARVPQLRRQDRPHLVTVENLHGAARRTQAIRESVGDRRLAGTGQAGEPDSGTRCRI